METTELSAESRESLYKVKEKLDEFAERQKLKKLFSALKDAQRSTEYVRSPSDEKESTDEIYIEIDEYNTKEVKYIMKSLGFKCKKLRSENLYSIQFKYSDNYSIHEQMVAAVDTLIEHDYNAWLKH